MATISEEKPRLERLEEVQRSQSINSVYSPSLEGYSKAELEVLFADEKSGWDG
jgi:hypothetical protein